MRHSNRLLVSIAAILLLSSLAAAWAGLTQEPSLACTSGRKTGTIKLLAVRYGTRHQYPWGPLWRRVKNAVAHEDPDVWNFSFPTPELGCLVRCSGTDLGLLSVRYDDEHGCRFDDVARELAGAPIEPGLCVFHTAIFPRRSRSVKVVVHQLQPNGGPIRSPQTGILDYDGYTLEEVEPAALCCTVENSGPAAFPVWHPEPMPITRRFGRTAFTLAKFEPSVRAGGPPNERRAQFHVAEGGRASSGWFPFRSTIQDATGNQTVALPLDDGTRGEACVLGGLCTREQAWRLKVTFERMLHTSAPPDCLWTVRGAPIPVSGIERLQSDESSWNDLRLTYRGIVSNNEIGRVPGPYRYYSVWVSAGNTGTDGMRISLVRVQDNRGRDLTMPLVERRPEALSDPYVTSQVVQQLEPIRYLPVRALPDSRTLDLTFAIYRGRTAEFLVKP